jgi:hypothetical protein
MPTMVDGPWHSISGLLHSVRDAVTSPVSAVRYLCPMRLCCELYNAAVQERREAWRQARVSVSFRQQSAQLPAIKAERPDVAGVYSRRRSRPDALRDLERRHRHREPSLRAPRGTEDATGPTPDRAPTQGQCQTTQSRTAVPRHLAALPLRCPRTEDTEPTLASVSGVWVVGRS